MLVAFALHFGHVVGTAGHQSRRLGKSFRGTAQGNGLKIHRVISKAPSFVSLAVAFVASTFAAPSTSFAQASGIGIVSAAFRSGVSGVVRDSAGRPQIGTLVELLNAQYDVVAQTFTDDRGRYALPRLNAGRYQLKATNTLFLPAIRPDLHLFANSRVIVNLTLSTVYQALQLLPAEPRTRNSAADDWSWTLRLSANRPLLRVVDPEKVHEPKASTATRRVTVRNGFAAFGQGGFDQQVVWSEPEGESRGLLLEAHAATDNTGLGRISSTGEYREQLSPDRLITTTVTVTDRPGVRATGADGLVTAHVRSAATVRLGDLAEVSTGTELVLARLGAEPAALGSHPFVTVVTHTGQTAVEYRLVTARSLTGADDLEEEAAEDAPLLSQTAGTLHLEQGLHQELRVSRKVRSWTAEASLFHDTLRHPVVNGAVEGDEAAIDSKNVLYDPGTGTIAVSGQGYSHGGVLAMLRDQLSAETWLSLSYAMSDVLSMPVQNPQAANPMPGNFPAQNASALAVAAGTRFAATGTTVRGSYRQQPVSTLTQVAPFASNLPGPYLGFSVKQPLHLQRAGSGRVEAILDVRNLLAQGYRPFLSQDGTTVYFTQGQRCIAGGLSFSF